jgi:hypothetical protein
MADTTYVLVQPDGRPDGTTTDADVAARYSRRGWTVRAVASGASDG